MQNRTEIPDCICQGNWRILFKEYSDRYGHRFVDRHGEVFTFVGLVDADDDYYFLMIAVSTGRAQLLSCVGNIEDFGYKEVP